MNKKYFVSLILAACVIFSFTFCLANDNGDGLHKATNDIRNFVGGVEDKVENGARDLSNASKDATGTFENSMNGNDNIRTNNIQGSTSLTDNNNGRYSATRTSTDNTVMGMSSTAWTWLIVGIAAIAIIAIIWYYSMRMTNNDSHEE